MDQSNAQHRNVVVRIPGVVAVAALGEFNNWSTVSTVLERIGTDQWELRWQPGIDLRNLCFFVWDSGRIGGRVLRPPAYQLGWQS